MSYVLPGVPFGFEYSAYDGDRTLFMAALIYVIAPGGPTLVATIGMPHIANGTYAGTFTGQSGMVYLIQKSSYTDGTYSTVDTTRPPGSDTIECYQLQTSSSGGSAINLGGIVSTPNIPGFVSAPAIPGIANSPAIPGIANAMAIPGIASVPAIPGIVDVPDLDAEIEPNPDISC